MTKSLLKALIPVIFVISSQSFAATNAIVGPWMTGPLLAPSGHTIPAGHVNVETYVFHTDDYGVYNDQWKVSSTPKASNTSPTLIVSYGLNEWMDLQLIAPYNFNSRSGQSDDGIGDTSVTLGFQLLNDVPDHWTPDLRFALEETFPTGRYENLNPVKQGTQITGSGLYQTSIATNFQKRFALQSGKFLRARLSLVYTLPAETTVTGFNAFGGGLGTNGKIRSGDKFNADFALEYTLTQHWVAAMDVAATIFNGSEFAGMPGVSASGLPAMTGYSSGDLFSLAPAIEYNFSPNVGIIAGSWFSVRGRNAPDFAAAVIALNIYH